MPLSKINVAEIVVMIKSVADPLVEKIKQLENDCENMRKELSSVRDTCREKTIFLEEKICILEKKSSKTYRILPP